MRAEKAFLVSRMATVLAAALSLAAAGGCATLHPVPAGEQPLASTNVAGIVVSVPRLDTGDYPGDVLDVSTAVLVVIENQSQNEIIIDPESFQLGQQGGMQMSPISPQQLAFKTTPPAEPMLAEGTALAWRGGGGGHFGGGGSFHMSAPAPRFGGGGARVSPGVGVRVAPAYRGGYFGGRGYYGGGYSRPGLGWYGPRNYGYGTSRWGWWGRGPLYWGPNYYTSWYGSSLFWPWFYDGPRYYAYSRADAIQLGLPAGRLPPGGRTGGFLYFPRIEKAEGLPLNLQWTIREATTQQPMGTAVLPLEMHAD